MVPTLETPGRPGEMVGSLGLFWPYQRESMQIKEEHGWPSKPRPSKRV